MLPIRLVDATTNAALGEGMAEAAPRIGERIRFHARGRGPAEAAQVVEGEVAMVFHDVDDMAAPPKRDKPLTTRVTVLLRMR